MKSVVAAVALLLAAGSSAGAIEEAGPRDAAPAAVIAQFSQAIPPEPPVVAELPEQRSTGSCCRTKATQPPARPGPSGGPCGCCRNSAPRSDAKGR